VAAIVGLFGGGSNTEPPRTSAPSAQAFAAGAAAGLDAGQVSEQDAVGRVLAYTPVISRGGGAHREIALTFDDGPGKYTPAVLAALHRLHVHATFFVVGSQERFFHAATAAAIRGGHVVGDHTETHARLTRLAAPGQYAEMLVPLQWLSLYGLPRPLLFRPPYGAFNQDTVQQLKRLGMLMVLWSVDTQDYVDPGVRVVVKRALEGAHPGAIMLMHDGGGNRSQTVAAIPIIVRALRRRHYRLVTVTQLLKDDPPPRDRPLPHVLTGR
jgi:peptidoglycan/xylan/chitin deacetylase (PgdA/CDA1 family)